MPHWHVGVTAVASILVASLGGCLDAGADVHQVIELAQELGARPAGVVALDARRYRAPATVHIAVADSNLDALPDRAELARVSVSTTSSPGGRTVTLRETGPSTGVFEGAVRIGLSDAAGELLVAVGDTLTARYRDVDDGTGNLATAVATALVYDPIPDLTVAVVAPAGAPAGGSLQVTLITTARVEAGAVQTPTALRLWLVDRDGQEVLLADRRVPALAPGASDVQLVPVSLPVGIAGAHRLRAVADVELAVAERDEANNVLELPLTVVGADLTVAGVGAPPQALAGSELELTVAVANDVRGGSAAASTVRLYLADASGQAVAHLADRAVAALPPGASDAGAARVVIPTGLVGEYRIRAIADASGAVPEHDEGNNGLDVPFAIVGADLAVLVSTPPGAVRSGSTLEVRATVSNHAIAGAAPRTHLRLTLVDAAGKTVAHLADRPVAVLSPGGSQVVVVTVTLPPGLDGTYRVRAMADLYGAADERDEDNNSADATVEITADALGLAAARGGSGG